MTFVKICENTVNMSSWRGLINKVRPFLVGTLWIAYYYKALSKMENQSKKTLPIIFLIMF